MKAIKQTNIVPIRPDDIYSLTSKWRAAKQAVTEAQKQLLNIEIEIYHLVKNDLRPTGVNNFNSGLKITTKIDQKWDSKLLHDILKKHEFSIPVFKIEYKPVKKASVDDLQALYPDEYKLIEPALTLRPAKPSFTYKDPMLDAYQEASSWVL